MTDGPRAIRYLKRQCVGLLMLTFLMTTIWWSITQSHGGGLLGSNPLDLQDINDRDFRGREIVALDIPREWTSSRSKVHPAYIPRLRDHYRGNLSSDSAGPRCPTSTTSGPIRRSIHISKQTSGVSVFKVSGDGLHQARVGISTNISIKLQTPQQAIDYPWTGPFFSVLAVGERHMFTADPLKVDPKSLSVNFTYTPTIPGVYDLYVEQISEHSQTQLEGSPFKLVVTGTSVPGDEIRRRADALPSCQTLPQTVDPSWVEGDWVTRELAGDIRGALRSGWVYQPKECSLDVFTTEDLVLAASSLGLKTIVVMGRSTDRGIFLSLVDLLLKRSQKLDFVDSDPWKCWGYAEVRVGNVRLVFRDLRIEQVLSERSVDGNHVRITCYGNKTISRNSNYFDDVIWFLRESIFKDQLSWPDVMFLVAKNVDQMRRMMRAMPPTWNGTVYATHNFKLQEGFRFTAEGREADIRLMEAFATVDSRIRTVDGFALARTMRHTSEKGPKIMEAHWHRTSCDEYNGTVRVCGDGVEIMAQWLLANALAPEGKSAWLDSLDRCPGNSAEGTGREIRVCHDCQLSFMPFHIQPPNPTCYTTRIGLEPKRVDSESQTWDGSFCPKECMTERPTERVTTGSGTVEVRSCSVPKS